MENHYAVDMSLGTILELLSVAMLVLLFGTMMWMIQRKQGIPIRYAIALGILFFISLGTICVCRMSFIGSIGTDFTDDK